MSEGRESMGERLRASCNDFMHRIARMTLNIIDSISRTIRRWKPWDLEQQQQSGEFIVFPEELLFLTLFQREYGNYHPFFYACRFVEALKIARDESKLVFIYLHAPEDPQRASFCHDTLCSELAIQFLDANFVSWGAVANRGEGLQMAATLQVASLPICAIVAPAAGDNILVLLQQIEGPVSPEELVEILHRTIKLHGPAFRSSRTEEEERVKANRQLREEQDAAYQASLQKDQEKDKMQEMLIKEVAQVKDDTKGKENENLPKSPLKQPTIRTKEPSKETQRKETMASRLTRPITKILIRFPNGVRKEQSFLNTDTIRSIHSFIDSLDLPGVMNYQLISNFPRRVYGFDQLDMTLKDADLHPSATLFLELLS